MTVWLTPSDLRPDTPPYASLDPVQPRPESFLTGKRVVIVEDEGMTIWQMRKMLTLAGMDVVGVASDGYAGVDIVLRERPDIVLMDIAMPRMDGLEATRLILEHYATCVVVVTAYDQHRPEAERLGAAGYIIKPVTHQTLIPDLEKAYRAYLSPPTDA